MSSNDANKRKTNRPICFNYEVPCEDCIQPVTFVNIPKFYVVGEKIVVNYNVLKTFNPKSEDWVGLFKCCHDIDKCFEFIGFKWAQKRPSRKCKPLSRTVVFYSEDLDIQPSEDKFIFLYITTNERIIGQSSLFDFKIFSMTEEEEEAFENALSSLFTEKMSEKEILEIKEVTKDEIPVITVPVYEEKPIEKMDTSKDKSVFKFKPELLPKPWNKKSIFKKISLPNYMSSEESEKDKTEAAKNKVKEILSKEEASRMVQEEAATRTEIELAKKSQSQITHVADIIQIFEKLIKQETTLVGIVNNIEKRNEEYMAVQKNVQEQILQYMKNIDVLARPQKSFKNQQTQFNKPKRKLTGLFLDAINKYKNVRYYFPKDDTNKVFSGSEMTFKNLFNEIKQESVPSNEMIDITQVNQEYNKTTKVRKAATDISSLLKELLNRVEDSAMPKKRGVSISLQNNLERENRTINFDDFNQLLKKKKSLQMSVQLKNENIYSGSSIAINLLFDQEIKKKFSNDNTSNEEAETTNDDKKSRLLKVTLGNKRDLNQSVLKMTLNDFFTGICDNEPVFLDICKNDDLFKRQKGKTPKDMDVEKDDCNFEKILSATSDVVEQFKSRSLNEKLLTSSSYPTGNRRSSAACERFQKLRDKMFPPKDINSKTYSEDGKISNASMAVQIGSAEETTAAILSPTPAVTRLTLLDSYEILASSRQNQFDYNRSIKHDHMSKLISVRNILESNMTDEDKIMHIENLTTTCPVKVIKPKKQFQYRQWTKKNKRFLNRDIKTEHETSDTSGESCKMDKTTISFPPNEFKNKKRSKKLKRNKFGRNKFTQTTEIPTAVKIENQNLECSLDDIANFPKLVRKPLTSSIIPVLLSDSKNSIHASSEEDFKTKPILKKKASPLPQIAKECSYNSRKTSVTFLVDASIQCETSDLNKTYEDYISQNFKMLTPFYIDETSIDSKSSHSDMTNQEEEPQGHKRERKVSFNTIILTSLFDNEEGEKDDQKGNIKLIRPSGKSTWPVKEAQDLNANKIPQVHQFLDFIEREVKNVTENTTVLQNSLNKAMKIFKAEAVMLKDRSTDILTKAIRAISPQTIPVERKPSPAGIEIKLTSVSPLTETKNRISRSRSNEPRLPNTPSPRDMFKSSSPVSENLEYEKAKKAKLQLGEENQFTKRHTVKSDKDLEYLNKEIELQIFLQNFLKQVKTLTDEENIENEPEKTLPVEPALKEPEEDSKVLNDDTHQVKKTTSDSPKVPQCYWDMSALKDMDNAIPKNESNTSIVNNAETPVVSLYSQSDCYKSSYTVGTQSLINSYCPSSNSSEHQRVSGMMLLQSFDSTISNIIKLYNNFTNYAYSSLTSCELPGLHQRDAPMMDSGSNKIYTCPNPSRSESKDLVNDKKPETDFERRPSYDYKFDEDETELKVKVSLPMSFSKSDNEVKQDKMSTVEKPEMDLIKFTDVDHNLDASVQDQSDELKKEKVVKETNLLELEKTQPETQSPPTPTVEKTNQTNVIVSTDFITQSRSKEFCLTCSDEFPSLKKTIEVIKINKISESFDSGSSKKSSKRKKD